MAINYFQGADASLVAAAAKSGTIIPPDYGKTFQSVADSYHKSMMASADMWGKLAEATIKVAEGIAKSTEGPELSKEAEAIGDQLTMDLAAERGRAHKKQQWLLKSNLSIN